MLIRVLLVEGVSSVARFRRRIKIILTSIPSSQPQSLDLTSSLDVGGDVSLAAPGFDVLSDIPWPLALSLGCGTLVACT